MIEASAPASGAAFSTTVTVALAGPQGDVPLTVYTYAPAGELPGVYVAGCAPPGPTQVPPASAPAPNRANRLNGASLLHTVIEASAPASGADNTVTSTPAVDTQPAPAVTV